MKSLKQILIILAAALVVTGITYAIGQSSSAQETLGLNNLGGLQGEGRGRPEGNGLQRPEGFEGRGESGERGGHHHEADPFGTASLFTFGQTILPIILIMAVVIFLSKGIRFARRRLQPG